MECYLVKDNIYSLLAALGVDMIYPLGKDIA